MSRKSLKILGSAALALSVAIPPAAAQFRGNPPPPFQDSYNDGYREGYRIGYEDGRVNRRFDDRDRRGFGPGPGAFSQEDRWRQNYGQTYTYRDDAFYQQCRQQSDPAGVIAGAIIGGLLGNAFGQGSGRTGATVAGLVVGGAAGAALTSNMNCQDRSYAYRTYHTAFSEGRPNRSYEWRNPASDNRGVFRVGQYYDDPYGFRCATFSQTIYVRGRPQEAQGRACRQPDGTWTIVG